jgi:hypothetical protein
MVTYCTPWREIEAQGKMRLGWNAFQLLSCVSQSGLTPVIFLGITLGGQISFIHKE